MILFKEELKKILKPTLPVKVKMIKIFKFLPCNTPASLIEFNASTLSVTGGISELNLVGYLNITKDLLSPIAVRLVDAQFEFWIDQSLFTYRWKQQCKNVTQWD
jgi:hypothetical protein